MKRQRLTDGLVESRISKVFGEFRQTGKLVRQGILDREAGCREMERGFADIFGKLLSDNQLKLCITAENYPRFAEESAGCRKDCTAENSNQRPWLYDTAEEPCEAAEGDRRQFFYLMEQFHAAPDFFEPVPENIIIPDIVPVHQYTASGVYGTHFSCTDGGGLLTDESPAGKTFRLVNDLGLEAVLTIREDRRNRDRHGMDFDELVSSAGGGLIVVKADFLAEGYIEGYTAKEGRKNPEILIRLRNRGQEIYWLAYWADRKDEEARNSFPLWQEYFRWCERKDAKRREMLMPLLEEFVQADGRDSGHCASQDTVPVTLSQSMSLRNRLLC